MTVKLMKGDIFTSKAQCLVCPVNTQGTMGAGLALKFKQKFPECEYVYRNACTSEASQMFPTLAVGGDLKWYQYSKDLFILFFATKVKWSQPSRLEWIERGLARLTQELNYMPIKSVAMPYLGCGLGNLNAVDVGNLVIKYLDTAPALVELWQYTHDYIS